MPKLVNRNPHAIRATDADGVEHRLRSGQVTDASGAKADALKGVSNVDTANKSDEEAWDAARKGRPSGSAQATVVHVTGILTKARIAGRLASVVLPLNEVVGDDDAPHGPPSGVITTKQAVARQGEVENDKFGQRERMPEDADNEKLSPVERAQASAVAQLEELHDEVLAEAQSDDEPADAPADGE